jgi:hypothetical protein
MTTEVAVFWARVSELVWRYLADAMSMLVAKWTADFMVSFRSFGSGGRAKRGMP